MQYVLSEEEMKGLVARREIEVRDAALEVARVAILGSSRCIHDRDPKGRGLRFNGYCDDCPVAALPADAGRMVCRLTKSWSK